MRILEVKDCTSSMRELLNVVSSETRLNAHSGVLQLLDLGVDGYSSLLTSFSLCLLEWGHQS
jgi:hypothetical protein